MECLFWYIPWSRISKALLYSYWCAKPPEFMHYISFDGICIWLFWCEKFRNHTSHGARELISKHTIALFHHSVGTPNTIFHLLLNRIKFATKRIAGFELTINIFLNHTHDDGNDNTHFFNFPLAPTKRN